MPSHIPCYSIFTGNTINYCHGFIRLDLLSRIYNWPLVGYIQAKAN